MGKNSVFLQLLFFLLFACGAFALPVAPADISIAAVESGIKISWQETGTPFFNVYRGTSFENAVAISLVQNTYFVDENIEPNIEYFYFVKSVDENLAESAPSRGYSVKWVGEKKPVLSGQDFNVSIIEPFVDAWTSFGFGETIRIVLQVNSASILELNDFNAILLNSSLGTTDYFSFDAEKKQFFLELKLPRQEETKSLPLEYNIWAAAKKGNTALLDSKELRIFLVPKQFINLEGLFPLIGFLALVLFLASSITFVWWKWSLQRKTERDRLRFELLKISKERAIWRYDLFQRRISEQQFAERDRDLQGEQMAVEKKLGIAKKGMRLTDNPFNGYSAGEIEEIFSIVTLLGKPKQGMTVDSVRAMLVGEGKSERVAKKVAELMFEKIKPK